MARVHLINPLETAFGGSELHTMSLFEEIAQYGEVNLWTEYKFDARFTGRYPIRGIEPHKGIFPRGGTLVFIGVYFGVGGWVKQAAPERIVVFFNTPDWDRLPAMVEGLQAATGRPVEVVYHSEEQRRRYPQYSGILQPCLIDLTAFHPARRDSGEFVVGRLSRDEWAKFHDEDPKLFERLGDLGCHVRIQGGTVLSDRIGHPNVQLHPVGTLPAPEFLRSLDCFLYRVHETLFETWGRVVAEAMATGLPVVAENRGGYATLIRDGETGFLFENTDQAFVIVRRLKDDPELRRRIGDNAREATLEMFSEASRREIAEYYLR